MEKISVNKVAYIEKYIKITKLNNPITRNLKELSILSLKKWLKIKAPSIQK